VTKRDIEAYAENAAVGPSAGSSADHRGVPEPVEVVPLTSTRRAIAEHLMRGQREGVVVSVFEQADPEHLLKLISDYRERFQERGARLSLTVLIIKAAAAALKLHPKLNSSLDMERGNLILRRYYHIGVAVDTPEGLIVPIIRHADRKSLFQIARELRDLIGRAKRRELTIDELKGGTFSITNYGTIAGTYATPMLSYPQTAILGLGRIMEQPVVRDGLVVPGKVLPLSLGMDHRVIDGGDAGRFLKEIIRLIEEPIGMFME
jgi:pyruvate dehydrogenase E2 component (dihydrolipoamide acetyltransferase)